MLGRGDRVLVAVSGGPDSVGLLAVLAQLRRHLEIDLIAAHVNHRLRGVDAEADERCAAEAASELGVSFVRCDLPAELRTGGNLEERARQMRYAALHRLAREAGCTCIATGHTQDDQAETVLLRLIRGAGPAGLVGVQPRRDDGVVRPLIDCRRAEVEALVRHFGFCCRNDTSNQDPRFARTHVRHRVLPILQELNPSVVQSLARAAALCGVEAAAAAAWAREQLGRVARDGELDLVALAELPEPLRLRVTRAWLADAGVPERRLTARHVGAVLRLAQGTRASGSVALPMGRTVRRVYRRLRLGGGLVPPYEPRRLEPGGEVGLPGGWWVAAGLAEPMPGEMPRPADLWSAICDADAVAGPLTVRAARKGERVRPLSLQGSRKLSDVFTDRKIPGAERWTHPVVASGDEVVWVPGVLRGEAGRVEPHTRRILWLRARRDQDQ
jgi:tRNA(Ile)-lysidine synthase